MIFDNIDKIHNKKQGNIGEARAIYEYTKLGYEVSIPFSDTPKYDLIVDDGISLKRVQIKTSRLQPKRKNPTSVYYVNLKTNGGNTKKNNVRRRKDNDYDLIFILLETGECWSIPKEELGNVRTQLSINSKKCKFKKFKMI